ncbi:PREDICTED: ankyrin repeat and SOCS box protein 9 isoform X2 [Hipposideros armiger]|uniref:Ankyrin repeat and SOCS box protein 9 isoform X2 n=1 Tax=Hipposideros armiger TaxID=186990 RepID=A0A8B7T9U6_HIPAR|nr:PREDICTED: ankyrin repeat and SOCS box protein 9 isoform X2 [Hipposideros armiger]
MCRWPGRAGHVAVSISAGLQQHPLSMLLGPGACLHKKPPNSNGSRQRVQGCSKEQGRWHSADHSAGISQEQKHGILDFSQAIEMEGKPSSAQDSTRDGEPQGRTYNRLLRKSGSRPDSRRLANPLMGHVVSDRTPVHEAAIHGSLFSLKKLLSQGWPVNLVTADHVSPLHEACLGGHPSCANILLRHGALVNGITIDWHTPLFNACVSGSQDCVNLLLKHGASLCPPSDLASPLHEAAKRGASVNQGRGLDSPLHAVARISCVPLARLLIDFGANTQAKNAEGKRPLELVSPESPLFQLFLQREGPPSLMQLCRLRIRKSFGIQLNHKVSKLFLPEEVKEFLLHV